MSQETDNTPTKNDSGSNEVASAVPGVESAATLPTNASASTVSTASFESFLRNTLFDLHARSEVEATVKDLVTDVEFAVNLQDQLSVQTHQSQAERIIAEQELALQETHVVQKDRLDSQTLLADAMVIDLWTLSKELGSLLELKQKHETMILEYDELVAKLAQAEEDLHAARSAPPAQQQQQQQQPQTNQQQQSTASTTAAPVPATQATPVGATIVAVPPEKPKPEATEKPAPAATAPAATASAAPTAQESASAAKAPPKEAPKTAAEEPKKPPAQSPAPAPVVALVEDETSGGTPVTLETIDMEILMRIFGFLDAYDILNTAQVNISMYSRVDSLFGFGMDAPIPDDNVSTTSTLATTPTVAAATATPTTASVSSSTVNTAATKKAPPPAAAKAPPKPAEPQFGQRLVGGGRNILNLLQGGGRGGDANNADANKRNQSPKRRGAGAGGGRGGGDANDSKPPLSEAMAHSMAAKLNDAEINAIISMTEKLRSKEKQVSLLIKEKEELEGKLSGSEAVKDFLITKVRDMEKIVNKNDETEKKVTQQIASDQEVIAFLDGRVQELERTTRVIQKEKSATQDKLKAMAAQNDKKVAVLSDMLQFERQKLKENEREWKATKKLLVKEVKGCRAQIVALQAERDGFREQNDALRKAVMAGGSSSNGGRSSSPHR